MSIKTVAAIGVGALITYGMRRMMGGNHFEATLTEMCFLLFVLTCLVGDLVNYHYRVTVSNAMLTVSTLSEDDKAKMMAFFEANKSRLRAILG